MIVVWARQRCPACKSLLSRAWHLNMEDYLARTDVIRFVPVPNAITIRKTWAIRGHTSCPFALSCARSISEWQGNRIKTWLHRLS